jgi:hypothetical protein
VWQTNENSVDLDLDEELCVRLPACDWSIQEIFERPPMPTRDIPTSPPPPHTLPAPPAMAAVTASPALARPQRPPRALRKSGARVSVRALRATATAAVAKYDTVIVGAGVSGLSTAFTLMKDSPSTSMLVTEARDRVGGNITTRSENGYTWEEGPNSYQPGDPILTLACDAGMRDEIVLADPDSDRFVLWDGELRALPKDIPTAVLGTFLTWPGKIRAGLGAIGIRPPAPGREESVKEFVSRNLGSEGTCWGFSKSRTTVYCSGWSTVGKYGPHSIGLLSNPSYTWPETLTLSFIHLSV